MESRCNFMSLTRNRLGVSRFALKPTLREKILLLRSTCPVSPWLPLREVKHLTRGHVDLAGLLDSSSLSAMAADGPDFSDELELAPFPITTCSVNLLYISLSCVLETIPAMLND